MTTRRPPAARRPDQRGFTLVEAMVVVIIVGILSAIVITASKKYITSSKTSEATQMLGSIKGGQESYYNDTMAYLDVSQVHAIPDLSTFYPTSTPGGKKWQWGLGTGAIPDAWRALNLTTDGGGLYFTYGCAAGNKDDAVAAATTSVFGKAMMTSVSNWPATVGRPWYVIKAVGDLDADGKDATAFLAASFTEQIYMETNGE